MRMPNHPMPAKAKSRPTSFKIYGHDVDADVVNEVMRRERNAFEDMKSAHANVQAFRSQAAAQQDPPSRVVRNDGPGMSTAPMPHDPLVEHVARLEQKIAALEARAMHVRRAGAPPVVEYKVLRNGAGFIHSIIATPRGGIPDKFEVVRDGAGKSMGVKHVEGPSDLNGIPEIRRHDSESSGVDADGNVKYWKPK